MKFTLMSLFYGLLVGLFAAPDETPRVRPHASKQWPNVPAALACVEEPSTTELPACEEATTTSSSDLKPVRPPESPVTLNEPPRSWVLSDKTWRAMAESRVNFDVNLDRGHEYIGVRIILPFGS